MPYYVCKGAKLKCSMGSDQSALEVMHLEKPVNLHGKPMAGIMDHKPMVNIKPFGQCKSLANPVVASATAANYGRLQEMPCIPNTMSPWFNGKMDVFVKGHPALVDASKCACAWAGVIEVADAGQKTISYRGQVGTVSAGAGNAAATPGGKALASQGTEAGAAGGGRLLIRKVESETEGEALPGDLVTYKVADYSIGENIFSTYQKSLSTEEKNRIRWGMKIGDGGIKELTGENGEKMKGEGIKIKMGGMPAGTEIVVMACIEGFNEDVSQRTRITKLHRVDFLPISFDTIDEAGKYAVRNVNQRSIDIDKEFGGRIYELGGRYYINSPIEGEKDRIEALPESRRGGKLVGMYHTHGRSYKIIDQEFSPYDIAKADEYGIVAYLGTTINKDKVRKYALKPPLAPRKEENIDENYLKFLKASGYINEL